MASKSGVVWAVDVGNNSLKALRLGINETGSVEVTGFDSIEHTKILTGVGVTEQEREELVAISLRQFVEQNDLGKDDIAVSVPSQNSFARFVNLPPVERKRIPEVVKFEAAQQIPFDINDVQWDWQLMTENGGSENRVGIFAIKNEVVDSVLEHFSRENLAVKYVQMAPMALYNYALYDRSDWGNSDNQAVILIDIGAENTDLAVCTRSAVWQRCIAMGGNAFTKAIADAFRLNFQRAEKLKRTAPMSKYARQIFQAMRPVFSDLASEIQRSLNFYSSSNPDTKLLRVVAFGGGTKMRGLLKYLKQTLQLPVERPDSFAKLAVAPGVSTTKFHESVPDFGVVYGLALQGLGVASIESNLLPRSIAKSISWANKAKYFTLAASLLLLASVASLGRTFLDKYGYDSARNALMRKDARNVISRVEQADRRLQAEKQRATSSDATIKKAFEPFEYRGVLPLLYQTVISSLPNEKNNPDQAELYEAFSNRDVKKILEFPRKERKQVFITGMSVRFVNNIDTATLGEVDFITGGAGADERGLDERGMAEMRYHEQGAKFKRTEYFTEEEEGEKAKPGFVVIVKGYSPYGALYDLMDPMGVGEDRQKWGVLTRLLHLADSNSPFELYERSNPTHFKFPIGDVAVGAQMPTEVGVVEERVEQPKSPRTVAAPVAERVLVDPMTKEIISKISKPGGREVVNDQWFVLKLKFVWKDAPKPSQTTAASTAVKGSR
jgi:type IV pilus assembly protein PilM